MFSFGFTARDLVKVMWAGIFAFVSTFATLDAGIWKAPNFEAAKAAAIAIVPLALAAAFSAVKNAILSDSSRLKG